MPLTRTLRGTVSVAVSKRIACNQNWKCNLCAKLLPATFQIDHKVALADGGMDCPDNLQALCPNCHCNKTQQETIKRRLNAEQGELADAYEKRNDIYKNGKAMCWDCKRWRPIAYKHTYCPVIEARFRHAAPLNLSKFERVQKIGELP